MDKRITFKKEDPRTVQGKRGFTLVEVMAALGILAFGILAVASMQSAALLGTARSNAVTQATTVAMDRMERLLALPFTTWDTVPQDGDDSYFSDLPDLPPNVTSVEWEVQQGMAPVETTTRRITVTVGYRELQKPISLSCIKSKVEGE